MNMPLIVQGGGDSRAARPGGPVDARLEGRVALADGGVSIALECIDLHGSNARVRQAPSFCSVVKSAGVACPTCCERHAGDWALPSSIFRGIQPLTLASTKHTSFP